MKQTESLKLRDTSLWALKVNVSTVWAMAFHHQPTEEILHLTEQRQPRVLCFSFTGFRRRQKALVWTADPKIVCNRCENNQQVEHVSMLACQPSLRPVWTRLQEKVSLSRAEFKISDPHVSGAHTISSRHTGVKNVVPVLQSVNLKHLHSRSSHLWEEMCFCTQVSSLSLL